jgi:hypothetical protein
MKKILAMAAVVFSVYVVASSLMAYNPMYNITARKLTINPSVEDGGVLTPVMIDNSYGFSSICCFNPSTTKAYFGGSTTHVDGGYPICAASDCPKSEICMDTTTSSLYVNLAARVDGGLKLYCISGK